MADMRTVFRTSLVRALGIGLIVGLVVVCCRQLGLLETLELSTYDWTVRLSSPSHAADSHIVLISITEEDIQQLGQWPVSDATLAKTLHLLTRFGARTIGLDLYRDREVLPGRGELNEMFAKHPEIVTVMKFPDQNGKGVPGPPVLQGTNQVGFNDILVDPGGIVRRGFLFLENEHGTARSFSLLLALKYLEKENIVPLPDPTHPELMRIGKTTIPRFQSHDGSYVRSDANGYQVIIKFSGKHRGFTRISLSALLSGQINRELIEDKIVVIGSAAESVRDDFYTPYSLGRERHQQISGMELHARLISQFLRTAIVHEQPIRSLSEELEAGWIVMWGCLGALVALRLFSPWRLALVLGGGLGCLILLVYWAFLSSWWIPLLTPGIAWVAAGSVATAWMSKRNRQERIMIMELFSQHVSREVADTIWTGREEFLQGGRLRPQKLSASVLFADLEGFTSVAEQLDPQALMEWLNTYLMSMANVIAAYEGVVDDFFGDGVKANFGVPLARTNEESIRQDAINAVQCGIALIHEVQRLNHIHQRQGLPVGKVRIGIATGSVVVGSVGSAQRLKYTTVGDIVNVAARLEQLGKDCSIEERNQEMGSLIVTKDTHDYLDARWEIQDVGDVHLPGKQASVAAYRVVSGPSERIVLNS